MKEQARRFAAARGSARALAITCTRWPRSRQAGRELGRDDAAAAEARVATTPIASSRGLTGPASSQSEVAGVASNGSMAASTRSRNGALAVARGEVRQPVEALLRLPCG